MWSSVPGSQGVVGVSVSGLVRGSTRGKSVLESFPQGESVWRGRIRVLLGYVQQMSCPRVRGAQGLWMFVEERFVLEDRLVRVVVSGL